MAYISRKSIFNQNLTVRWFLIRSIHLSRDEKITIIAEYCVCSLINVLRLYQIKYLVSSILCNYQANDRSWGGMMFLSHPYGTKQMKFKKQMNLVLGRLLTLNRLDCGKHKRVLPFLSGIQKLIKTISSNEQTSQTKLLLTNYTLMRKSSYTIAQKHDSGQLIFLLNLACFFARRLFPRTRSI